MLGAVAAATVVGVVQNNPLPHRLKQQQVKHQRRWRRWMPLRFVKPRFMSLR